MKSRIILIVTALSFILSTYASPSSSEIAALREGLKSSQAKVRMQTADKIQKMDAIPDELMPALFELVLTKQQTGGLKEELIGSTARHFGDLALAKFGKRAVPRLRELMRNTVTRWEAVGILKRIGQDSGDAVPELIVALGDPNENVRALAVDTLNLLIPQATPAVDALIPLLHDRNENVQKGAIELLGAIGAPAAKATPELKKLLKPEYTPVAMDAADAIEKIEHSKGTEKGSG